MKQENNVSYAPRIKPVTGRIFVEMIPEEKKTKSGIILNEEINRDKPLEGKVIAVGEGVDSIKANDKILFSRASFNCIEFEKKEYYFLIEEDVLGVFEN